MNKNTLYILLAILLILVFGYLFLTNDGQNPESNDPLANNGQNEGVCTNDGKTNDSCESNGNDQKSGNSDELSDKIRLDSPKANTQISSPLTIRGEARGYWYFEGDFPVVLTDWDGEIIAQGVASAQDEWMTEDFVPFSLELEFETPDLYKNGSLILQRDNPSGLPENDEALEIPIEFAASNNSQGVIDLSGQNLSQVPGYVLEDSSIRVLDLSNNMLDGALPSEIRQLRNLEKLDVSNNQMTGIPAEIGQLSKLREINYANNQITGLPYELGNLDRLETLDLSGNDYSELDLGIIKEQLPDLRVIGEK